MRNTKAPEFVTLAGAKWRKDSGGYFNAALGMLWRKGDGFEAGRPPVYYATAEEAAAAALAAELPTLTRENYKRARALLQTPAAETWKRAAFYAKRGERLAAEKYSAPASIGAPFKSGGAVWRFVENPAAVGLRWVGWADEVANLRHEGWFVDIGGDLPAMRAAVYQFPARDGAPLFVAGIPDQDTGAGGDFGPMQFCISELFPGERGEDARETPDAAREAARFGDKRAERIAEAARDYDAAWRSGQRFAALGDSIRNTRRQILAVLGEARALRKTVAAPAICTTLRARVSDWLGWIADAREERAKLAAGDYVGEWLPGFYPSPELRAAFNDGAQS